MKINNILIIFCFLIFLLPTIYSVTTKEEILMNVSNSTEFYRHYFNVQTLDDSLIIDLSNIPRNCDDMKVQLDVYSTNSSKTEDYLCYSIVFPSEHNNLCIISLKDLVQHSYYNDKQNCNNQLKDLKGRDLYFNIKIEESNFGRYHLELKSFRVVGFDKFNEIKKEFNNNIANICAIIGTIISALLLIFLRGKHKLWGIIPILITLLSQMIRLIK
ncbi:MAG: hypothetical protein PHF86_08235 [Candidatus Nanoarchaeia archaeon]|nr:hypothetical protein [Candidatus Nanoarchaeia archaeon]